MRRLYFHAWWALYIDWLLISSAARAAWDKIPTECGHLSS